MRVLGQLRKHPKITTTVFHMNDKYVIKFEAGPMEQTFKLSQDQVSGLEGIDKMITEDFVKQVILRFNEMHLSFEALKN